MSDAVGPVELYVRNGWTLSFKEKRVGDGKSSGFVEAHITLHGLSEQVADEESLEYIKQVAHDLVEIGFDSMSDVNRQPGLPPHGQGEPGGLGYARKKGDD
jgi:hypothetical protein